VPDPEFLNVGRWGWLDSGVEPGEQLPSSSLALGGLDLDAADGLRGAFADGDQVPAAAGACCPDDDVAEGFRLLFGEPFEVNAGAVSAVGQLMEGCGGTLDDVPSLLS
jgi:hypothetical protein